MSSRSGSDGQAMPSSSSDAIPSWALTLLKESREHTATLDIIQRQLANLHRDRDAARAEQGPSQRANKKGGKRVREVEEREEGEELQEVQRASVGGSGSKPEEREEVEILEEVEETKEREEEGAGIGEEEGEVRPLAEAAVRRKGRRGAAEDEIKINVIYDKRPAEHVMPKDAAFGASTHKAYMIGHKNAIQADMLTSFWKWR